MFLSILTATIIFIAGELFSNLIVFNYINRYFKDLNQDWPIQKDYKTHEFLGLELRVFKGILERFILFVGLHYGYTAILAVFGTLKIGTRLDKTNKISNDYFLIGNLTTVGISVFYTVIHSKLIEFIHSAKCL